MTTYNTGNPVGSVDPKDLHDNAQNLDNIVNGSEHSYADRLGVARRSLAGIDAAADAVLSGLGYAPPVTYAAGISLTLTTQTVEYNGEVYAPKLSALPFTTGGTFDPAKFRVIQGILAADLAQPGGSALVGYDGGTAQDVLDDAKPLADYAALRAYTGRATGVRITQAGLAGFFQRDDADTTSADNGSTIIVDGAGRRWKRLFTGAINVKLFGAKGDGSTDDTAAIQAAANACPIGATLLFPDGIYVISDEIRLAKPITIRGSGMGNIYGDYTASSDDYFSCLSQTVAGKAAFKLAASLGNYAFGRYGILGVNFEDLQIVGPSAGSFAVAAITTDTTVNGGDYHIRHCSTRNLAIRYFTVGVDFTGIAYLNTFYNSLIYNCTTGWKIARGLASDNGGQNRWFGCTGISCDAVISFNEDGSGGSFAVYGSTLSESKYGIRANEECSFTVSGNEFESLQNAGNGAGVYIEIKEANPNSGAAKTIVGNKFLNSDADIWINKTTTAFAGGGFAWPMLIDGNTLNSSTSLRVTVPAGHVGIDSQQFVLGAANAGPNGPVLASQISANFYGLDARQRRTTQRITFDGSTPTSALLDMLPIGMILQTVRVYLTANASVFTALKIGDQLNDGRYAFFDAQSQALNTWVTYSSTLGDAIDSTRNLLKLTWTAGAGFGCTGVIEVDGFVS